MGELNAVEWDAQAVVAGLTESQGGWRADAGSWSVAECLDHLATANRVYLQAMAEPAEDGRRAARHRRGPLALGLFGRWFVRSLEPPVRPWLKTKALQAIRPRPSPSLADAWAGFLASHQAVRDFLTANADLDLSGVLFPNPFVSWVRMRLVTGLHVIAAHERRHLWQAWRVRRAAERVGA